MNRNSAGISKFLGQILQAIGRESRIEEVRPLSGGDINDVYLVQGEDVDCVIKLNSSGMPSDVFRLEMAGLNSLGALGFLHVPTVFGVSEVDGVQAIVLEHLQSGKGDVQNFGRALAKHHSVRQPKYGWEKDNYIGRLPQVNTPEASWEEFWSEHRISPLVRSLRDEGALQSSEVRVFDELVNRTSSIVPYEHPSLLHGDLWSGNVLPTKDSYAVIDPAVYAGHREMDLAMMKLFGGFSDSVFSSYQEVYPLETGWEERIGFHQLYPLLVHARMFGGLYIQQSVEAARRYL